MSRLVILLALMAATARLQAAGPVLEVRVWTELEPPVGGQAHPDDAVLRSRLLEQARGILGGMIYGYHFVYTPSDRARRVGDQFHLTPLGEIPWGDPRLSVRWVQRGDGRLSARIAYELADFQDARRRAWGSAAIPTAMGRGEHSIFDGEGGRRASLDAAIEQAVREYARGRMDNKPRELRGDLVIWDSPYTVIGPARYVTTVKVKLRIDTTIPYKVF